jgi:hypothetical protein
LADEVIGRCFEDVADDDSLIQEVRDLVGVTGRADDDVDGGESALDEPEYLGLSMDELRELMSDGQTLAEIAEESDKSVDGLIDAVVAAQKASLDEAVDEGRITDEMRDRVLDGLKDRVDDFVRDGMGSMKPPGGRFDGFPGGPGW